MIEVITFNQLKDVLEETFNTGKVVNKIALMYLLPFLENAKLVVLKNDGFLLDETYKDLNELQEIFEEHFETYTLDNTQTVLAYTDEDGILTFLFLEQEDHLIKGIVLTKENDQWNLALRTFFINLKDVTDIEGRPSTNAVVDEVLVTLSYIASFDFAKKNVSTHFNPTVNLSYTVVNPPTSTDYVDQLLELEKQAELENRELENSHYFNYMKLTGKGIEIN